nr:hypothetical protein [Tanacetum cinerariifolium]
MNNISHTLNVENFRDMLHICPRLPGQRFEDPPLEEEILSFNRDLSHTREIKVLIDVNVNYMHQPWRSIAAIINRCLSGKTTSLDSLCLSHLVYQVENNNSKKNNGMCYPRFTKVIIDYLMSKDQSLSRRNKMFWHTVRDDRMFNTIRVISRHQDTQIYGAILLAAFTNQEMLNFKAYKEYYAIASRAEPPKAKTKYKKKADDFVTSPKSKTASASKGTRLKSKANVTKPDMKKQPAKKTKAKGDKVDTQSKVPDEQQQKTFGIDEGTGTILGVPDVPPYESESDKEFWGHIKDEDDNDDDGDNDDDAESDDHDDNSDDERTKSDSDKIHDPNLTNMKKSVMMKKQLTMKKIVIYKMEANKSINRSDTQKNLFNALVESYNSEKDITTSYGDVDLLKRGRDDQNKDEDPSAGSDRGTKRRKSGKDAESSKDSRSKEKKYSSTSKDASHSQHKSFGKSIHVEEPSHTVKESGMQQDQDFATGDNDEQPVNKEVTKADWFKKSKRPLTPDPD